MKGAERNHAIRHPPIRKIWLYQHGFLVPSCFLTSGTVVDNDLRYHHVPGMLRSVWLLHPPHLWAFQLAFLDGSRALQAGSRAFPTCSETLQAYSRALSAGSISHSAGPGTLAVGSETLPAGLKTLPPSSKPLQASSEHYPARSEPLPALLSTIGHCPQWATA